MSGISATQGATVVNAGGTATFSVPQTGLIAGSQVTLALVGTTHASYNWILGAPFGSGTVLSDVSASSPTFTPQDPSAAWNVILQGINSSGAVEATYLLPLSIPQTELSQSTGVLFLPYVTPTQCETPGIGQVLYQDSTKAGNLSAKSSAAVTTQLALVRSGTTVARPTTTYLAVGTTYFDTTLGYQICWSGTNWVNSAGATV